MNSDNLNDWLQVVGLFGVNAQPEVQMSRITLAGLMLLAVLLTSCAGMPVSTMYKLHKLDPMAIDPAQLKVAIRADDRIRIPPDQSPNRSHQWSPGRGMTHSVRRRDRSGQAAGFRGNIY